MIESIALAALSHYTVQPGDTLSGIAASRGVSLAALEGDNPQIANPNLIYPGQRVKVPHAGAHLTAHASGSGGKVWDVTFGYPNRCGDGDGDGWDMSCAKLFPQQAAPASQPAQAAVAPAQPAQTVSTSGMGSFQQCVISRESGGNASAVNASSGAGGLYQFLPSTWASLGHSGLPENASVAEQNQAFAQEYAQSGTSAWSAYDGC